MQLDANLHRIGNDIIAAYLIVTHDGVTIIDAGLAGHWKELMAELSAIGLSLDDVKGVILTHGDSDHVGFAERLRRNYGVPVFIHPSDADRAKGSAKPKNAKQPMGLRATLGFVSYSLRKGGWRTTWLTEVLEVQDGETLDLPGSPQIIGLPGHSPGSIAIYSPAADAVFVGDGLTTRHVLTGQTGPRPAPFTDAPDAALASLQRIVATGAKWVLPGHGAPWNSGVSSAVAAVEAAAREAAQ